MYIYISIHLAIYSNMYILTHLILAITGVAKFQTCAKCCENYANLKQF